MSDFNSTIKENKIIGQLGQLINIIGNISNTDINVLIESENNELQILGQIASDTKIEAVITNGSKGNPFTYEDFTPEQLASLKVNINDLIIYVDNKYSLPTIGNIDYIYITKDEYVMYLWDSVNIIYQPLGMSSRELKTLIGGNATTDFEIE